MTDLNLIKPDPNAWPDLLPEGFEPISWDEDFVIDPKFAPKPGEQPRAVSYGAGRDSSAMLVGLWQRGEIPHLILFAHIGNEWPETYEALSLMQKWLKDHDMPPITVVKDIPTKFKHGPYHDLFGNCIQNRTYPSMTFGGKKCSLRGKAQVMDKFVKENCVQTREWLKAGGRVTRMIGYDDGAKDKCRGAVVSNPHLWEYAYPLREWHWDRDRCGEELLNAGLPLIHKSACVFCASMKSHELLELATNHPDLMRLTIEMEDWAFDNMLGNMTQDQLDKVYEQAVKEYYQKLHSYWHNMTKYRELLATYPERLRQYQNGETKRKAAKPKKPTMPPTPKHHKVGNPGLVKGLWRNGCAGKRDKSKYRPATWRQFCEENNCLPPGMTPLYRWRDDEKAA